MSTDHIPDVTKMVPPLGLALSEELGFTGAEARKGWEWLRK
jgi:hypothetical protein